MTMWQTLEEFKANPVDGWCWIYHIPENRPLTAYYYDGCFHNAVDDYYEKEDISHVMPLTPPDAPK